MSNSYRWGKLAEEKALSFLKTKGLKQLERNYRSPQGEIDIIMQDKDTIVFIEVRARTKSDTMNPVESIDKRKCEHIVLASQHYLQKHRNTNKAICRFDIVTLTGPVDAVKIEWLRNAFEA